MAIISKILAMIDSWSTTVDLSANTLAVGDLQVAGVPLSQAQAVAFYSGTIAGTATPVSISANTPGSVGNSIALAFTGSNSINAAIATWNGLHPSNQAILTAGDGSQIPSAQTINLSGGVDSGASVIVDGGSYQNFTPTDPSIAGSFRGIDNALVAVSGSQKVDRFTLNGTDITNKFVTLTATPGTPANTILLVEDAGNMYYGDDFQVIGNQLSWNGKLLDGILASGDKLTVTYKA